MREAQARLRSAHGAAVAQLEAELLRSRRENARLRELLAEAGAQEALGGHQCAGPAAPPAAAGSEPAGPPSPAAAVPTAPPSPLQSHQAPWRRQAGAPDAPAAELGPCQPALPRASTAADGCAGQDAGQQPAMPTREAPGPEDLCAELDRALWTLLCQHGLHQIRPDRQGSGASAVWTVAGVPVQLSFDGPANTAGGAGVAARRRLLASVDGGRTWEALDALISQRLEASQHEPPPLRPSGDGGSPSAATARQMHTTSLAELAVRPIQRPSPQCHDAAPRDGLPAWRSDGLPAFHNAFPTPSTHCLGRPTTTRSSACACPRARSTAARSSSRAARAARREGSGTELAGRAGSVVRPRPLSCAHARKANAREAPRRSEGWPGHAAT
ncbi:unnamed protein product, partial [Prorocentrum cordatum]